MTVNLRDPPRNGGGIVLTPDSSQPIRTISFRAFRMLVQKDRTCPAGDCLWSQGGHPDDNVYFLARGRVEYLWQVFAGQRFRVSTLAW